MVAAGGPRYGIGVGKNEEKAVEYYEELEYRFRIDDDVHKLYVLEKQMTENYYHIDIDKMLCDKKEPKIQTNYREVRLRQGPMSAECYSEVAYRLGDCYYYSIMWGENDKTRAGLYYHIARIAYFILKKEKDEIKCCKKLAEFGNLEAKYYLAECYFFGRGVAKNENEAKRLYNKNWQEASGIRFPNLEDAARSESFYKRNPMIFRIKALIPLWNYRKVWGFIHEEFNTWIRIPEEN